MVSWCGKDGLDFGDFDVWGRILLFWGVGRVHGLGHAIWTPGGQGALADITQTNRFAVARWVSSTISFNRYVRSHFGSSLGSSSIHFASCFCSDLATMALLCHIVRRHSNCTKTKHMFLLGILSCIAAAIHQYSGLQAGFVSAQSGKSQHPKTRDGVTP